MNGLTYNKWKALEGSYKKWKEDECTLHRWTKSWEICDCTRPF